MNLVDYVDRGARIAPHAPCMSSPDGKTYLTHAEFNDMTHRIAVSLIRGGVRAGDRVAVYSRNDPFAFACVVGLLRAGAVWTAVNAASTTAEIAEFLTTTGCSHLVYHAALTDEADRLVRSVPSIETVVAIGDGRVCDPSLAEWMAGPGERASTPPLDSTRVVMLLGTGGTTGRPKVVPINNRQFHLMCMGLDAHLAEPEPPRYICATPMTHAAGAAAFPVLAEGGCVIVHDGVRAEEILASIETNRATRLFLPPTALYGLLSDDRVREYDYSSLRHFLIGAAPIAPDRLAEAVDVFGPVMTQAFGQSEAPFICTFLPPEQIALATTDERHRRRLSSCGRPSLVARVEIMDDGQLLEPGERGEIVIRSDLVFDGYWGDQEATDETRRPGGWHGTGDVGFRDVDGFIYIIDRQKDIIITGGFNVFPSEVEAVIHGHRQVRDCAVIGIPDEKWGEAVTAVIEPKPGAEIRAEEIIERCRELLGPVKAPKSVVLRELPRSSAGKVLKRKLRDEFWADAIRKV